MNGGIVNITDLGLAQALGTGPASVNLTTTVCAVLAQDLTLALTLVSPP
ncbi:MAG TPA: hypothetical protein VGV13_16850 [Methylomirabilota bacterium]|nr:hypothetical protein [Methylomirabilota bacterium]